MNLLLLFCRWRSLFVGGVVAISGAILCVSTTKASDPAVAPSVLVQADSTQFDWAKLYARARIAYVSSGPKSLAVRMIDEDLRTVYRFDGSDASPVVIVELAESQQLHRVSATFDAQVQRVDIYLLNKLPKDKTDLGYLKPFASIVDPPEPGNASVDFAPSNARYVALRWTRLKTGRPFDVARVSAFSFVPTEPGNWALPSGPSGDANLPPPIAVVSPL